MRVLPDTRAFLWWLDDAPTLSKRASAAIAAQALEERCAIVSADPVFRKYGVKRIW